MAHLDCECVYPSHHTTNNTPLIAASCRTRGWARTPLWCPWPLVSLSFVAPHLPTHTNATPPPTGLEPGPDLHRGAPRQHRPDAGRLRASGGRRRELLQGALQVGGRCVGVGVHVRVCVATAVVARADSICNRDCKWLLSVLSFSLTKLGQEGGGLWEAVCQPPLLHPFVCRDARTVPAGGATEIELARQLQELGRKVRAAQHAQRAQRGQQGRRRQSLRSTWPASVGAHARAPQRLMEGRPTYHQPTQNPCHRPHQVHPPTPSPTHPTHTHHRRRGWSSTRSCSTRQRWR